MTKTTILAHNLAAIDRAIQSGYEAIGVADHYLVPSRSTAAKMYRVSVSYEPHGPRIACDCPAGHSQPAAGSTPCWHGALAMIQEQAAERATFDGRRWHTGPEATVTTRGFDSGPTCGVCGGILDAEIIVPPERQVVSRDGASVHRGCV